MSRQALSRPQAAPAAGQNLTDAFSFGLQKNLEPEQAAPRQLWELPLRKAARVWPPRRMPGGLPPLPQVMPTLPRQKQEGLAAFPRWPVLREPQEEAPVLRRTGQVEPAVMRRRLAQALHLPRPAQAHSPGRMSLHHQCQNQ